MSDITPAEGRCGQCGQALTNDTRALANAAFAGRKAGELSNCREQLRGAVEERDRYRAALEEITDA